MIVTNSAKKKGTSLILEKKYLLTLRGAVLLLYCSADFMSHAMRSRHVFLQQWRRCGRPSHINSVTFWNYNPLSTLDDFFPTS